MGGWLGEGGGGRVKVDAVSLPADLHAGLAEVCFRFGSISETV